MFQRPKPSGRGGGAQWASPMKNNEGALLGPYSQIILENKLWKQLDYNLPEIGTNIAADHVFPV